MTVRDLVLSSCCITFVISVWAFTDLNAAAAMLGVAVIGAYFGMALSEVSRYRR